MTITAPSDFSAKAIDANTIQLECSVPDGATQFDWQYTTNPAPTVDDWITLKTTDEYGELIIS